MSKSWQQQKDVAESLGFTFDVFYFRNSAGYGVHSSQVDGRFFITAPLGQPNIDRTFRTRTDAMRFANKLTGKAGQ